MADHPGKRKREEDKVTNQKHRAFNECWAELYYITERNGNPFCLICEKELSANAMKKSNILRHYEKVHVKNNHSACLLTGQLRKDKVNKLIKGLQARSSMFTKKVMIVRK